MSVPRVPGYRDLELLGQGGFGAVYAAIHEATGRRVALKILIVGTGASDKDRTRFRREARVLSRIRHPGIVELFDFGDLGDGTLFLTMQYVEGESLQGMVRSAPHPWPEVREVVRPASEALAYAHEQGIVHRDVKPGNVLVSRDGQVFLADFGLALALEDELTRVTRTGSVVGTLPYLAPEALVFQEMGPPGDVYALGILTHVLLTGAPPFGWPTRQSEILERAQRDAPRLPPETAPAWVRDLVAGMLERNAGRRLDAAAVLEALDAGAGAPEEAPAAPASIQDAATLELSDADTLELAEDAAAPPEEATREATAPRPSNLPRVVAASLLAGLVAVATTSLREAPSPPALASRAISTEHAPRGTRLRIEAPRARAVLVDGVPLEHDPVGDAWTTARWPPSPGGRLVRLEIQGDAGTTSEWVRVAAGWTREDSLPSRARIEDAQVLPVPFRPGATLRSPAWIRDAATCEAPPELPRGEPRVVRLRPSGPLAEGERALLALQLHGRSSPDAVRVRLGAGPWWPLGEDRGDLDEQAQPLVILRLPETPPGESRPEIELGLPDDSTPPSTLRGAWLLAAGPAGDELGPAEVLVARLEGQAAALDLAITSHWPEDPLGYAVLVETIGTGRAARFRRMFEDGWWRQPPWPGWLREIEGTARDLVARLRPAPAPARTRDHLLWTLRARRAFEALAPLLPAEARDLGTAAPAAAALLPLMELALGGTGGGDEFERAAGQVRAGSSPDLAAWTEALTRRLALDHASHRSDPAELRRRFVDAGRAVLALPADEPPARALALELMGILARTRDPGAARTRGLVDPDTLAVGSELAAFLEGGAPTSDPRDRRWARALLAEARGDAPPGPDAN